MVCSREREARSRLLLSRRRVVGAGRAAQVQLSATARLRSDIEKGWCSATTTEQSHENIDISRQGRCVAGFASRMRSNKLARMQTQEQEDAAVVDTLRHDTSDAAEHCSGMATASRGDIVQDRIVEQGPGNAIGRAPLRRRIDVSRRDAAVSRRWLPSRQARASR